MTDVAIPGTKPGALAIPEEWQALATFDDGQAAFVEHFGLSMPRLRSDFGKNGQGWIDDLTGEKFTELRAIFLALPPSRAFWLKTLDEGGEGGVPDCSSRVSFKVGKPDENVPSPQAESCESCPHSLWTPAEEEDGEDRRPRCIESINVLAHDVDNDTMFWLRFAGTAISPFRKYLSGLMARKLPFFSVITKVTLDERSKGKLNWLVPVFGVDEKLTPDVVLPYRQVAERAMAMWASVADELDQADRSRPKAADDQGARAVASEFDEEPF